MVRFMNYIAGNCLLFFAIIILTIICNSCYCSEDDELSQKRTNYSGSQLRIDGYYYQEKDGFYYSLYFFYRDGTILDGGGGYSLSDLSKKELEFSNGSYSESAKNYKSLWGLFKIDGNTIQLERWFLPFEDGSIPAGILSGDILNDTTFHITHFTRSGGVGKPTKDETYHFKRLSPKPDSTNNFVK